MKLDFSTVRQIATGVARIEEEAGDFRFYRFTKAQEAYYQDNFDFYHKTLAPPCVTLHFETDSPYLALNFDISRRAARFFFTFDLLINGQLCDSLTNIGDSWKGPQAEYPLGHFEKRFDLGNGLKEVQLVFPFSGDCRMHAVEVADGAIIRPIKADKTLLLFGDSITQGYDAVHPSKSYAFQLARLLQAEAFNKGIGAEKFCPGLLDTAEDFTPDYITVAYGTNDWVTKEAAQLKSDCTQFFEKLHVLYPTALKFAVLPIFRGDTVEERPISFLEARQLIAKVASNYGAIPIDSIDFVPHDPSCFSPDYLHPNDEGCTHYARNLFAAISPHLK